MSPARWDAKARPTLRAIGRASDESMLSAGGITSLGLPQEVSAQRLSITRPRLNDLLRGKLGKFSLYAFQNLTAAAGLTLELRITEAA